MISHFSLACIYVITFATFEVAQPNRSLLFCAILQVWKRKIALTKRPISPY